MKQVTPITMNANAASQRKSKRVAYLPTQKVSSTGITPIGAVARPAQIDVYPSVFCSHSGTSKPIEKNAAYASTSASVPAAKLRCRNRRRSTMGSSSVSSQTRNTTSDIVETIASDRIIVEWNQSSSLPLSSRTCSEPTPSTRVTSPIQSTRALRNCSTRLPSWAATTELANSPIGTLMKKIHSQE